jgi:hypothetical protein
LSHSRDESVMAAVIVTASTSTVISGMTAPDLTFRTVPFS